MLSRCADDLIVIATQSTREAQALANELRSIGNWQEVVAGIDSVVVQFDPLRMAASVALGTVRGVVEAGIADTAFDAELVEIPVRYGGDDGPDLEQVCATLQMSAAELIEMHCSTAYTVDMIGFTPGFAFVGGLDNRLRVSRHKQPRQHVAAGSIGIADGRTGIYAVASPGGWPLIGRTLLPLFRPESKQPFVLQAGTRVRFRALEGSAT